MLSLLIMVVVAGEKWVTSTYNTSHLEHIVSPPMPRELAPDIARMNEVYLHKVSFVTVPPVKRWDSGRPDMRVDVSISNGFNSGDEGDCFSSTTWEYSSFCFNLQFRGRWESNAQFQKPMSSRRRHL